MKNLFICLLLLGSATAYMEFVDGRGILGLFDKPVEEPEVVEEPKAPEPKEEPPEPKITDELVLVDLQGRDLDCKVVEIMEESVTVLRRPDQQKFTIRLNTLNAESRQKIVELREAMPRLIHKPSPADRFEEAKESVEIIVVVSEHTPNTQEVKRMLNELDVPFRIYDAEKSIRGRELVEEHKLTRGPTIIIEGKALTGFSAGEVRREILNAYTAKQNAR